MQQVDYLIENKNYVKNLDLIILDGGGNDILAGNEKEVGTVDMEYEGVTPGDTIATDFESIIYRLRQEFPDTKILFVQPWDLSEKHFEEYVFLMALNYWQLEDLNNLLLYYGYIQEAADSIEELKEPIIKVLREGIPEYGISPLLYEMENRADEIYTQIQLVSEKYEINYIDISQYAKFEDGVYYQGDHVHLTNAGYEKLTPYIVNKVKEMFK